MKDEAEDLLKGRVGLIKYRIPSVMSYGRLVTIGFSQLASGVHSDLSRIGHLRCVMEGQLRSTTWWHWITSDGTMLEKTCSRGTALIIDGTIFRTRRRTRYFS
jgi:hypothetical protein